MANWKELLQQGYDDMQELQKTLRIPEDELQQLCTIQEKFPMYVNPYYFSLIDPNDPEDPIRKMCIPSLAELNVGGAEDTSGEQSNTVITGMQHKYRQTVLILSTNQCAMYCRHCFRKRMVGLSSEETAEYISDMAQYVRGHKEVDNILVSGGDSFLNSNAVLRRYLDEFIDIPHLNLIRFGTRTPVVLPQRITTDPELVEMLSEYTEKRQIYVVTQFNHPNEVTEESRAAIRMLLRAGVVVKNQTVLLRGVNDSPEVLGELLRRIVSIGIVPYYIFQCRPVRGVHSQFQVPFHEAYRIVEGAKSMQDGQGKCVRYALSHVTGKIEILGELEDGKMLFKYHQAKYAKDSGRIFTQDVADDQCWLDEISENR
jgi:KamA family protein